MRRIRRSWSAAVAALAVVLVLGGCGGGDYTYKGGVIDPPREAAPINLTDQNGNPFTLATVEGKVTLLYFGYTTCPDLCPTTLSDFISVEKDLGDDASKAAFVLVSVDPERDTQQKLEEYLGFFSTSFIGLRGTEEETAAVREGYGVIATKVEYPDSATGYLIDHTSLIYVIDKDGKLRETFPYGTDPADISADVQHLIDE